MLGEYRREVLPNGLRVLAVHNPALHSFVCSVYTRIGPHYEAPLNTGLSHFLEHMLLQGSEHFPTSDELMRGIEDVGGVLDAVTYPEYINLVFGVHRRHWRRVIEIASDVVMSPLFDDYELQQEKLIITQELLQDRDRDGLNISVSELAYEIMFKEQPDEAGTRGTPGILQGFARDQLEAHYRAHYVPENMVVCLAGGFDFNEVLGSMRDYFGAMPAGDTPPLASPSLLRTCNRAVYRRTKALPQSELLLCHPSYALGDRRRDAARAVARLLGGGLSSRLFTKVREDCGLVYDIETYLQGYADEGVMETFLSASKENLPVAFEEALGVLKGVLEDGFTEKELARHCEGARCAMEMLLDRPSDLADWFGKQELLIGPDAAITPEQYIERQNALTLDNVQQATRDMLANGAGLAVVGPFGRREQRRLSKRFPATEVDVLPVL